MNPKLILLIIILITPFVFAEVECSKVLIVKFNYDNGLIAYKDKVIKCGYAPDRKIQPEYGYKAEILSVNNEPLYSFKFEIPLNLYLDISDPLVKSLSGGLLILNETDFALIFPYYDTAKSMVIYNEREYNILIVPLTEEKFIQKKSMLWIIILVAFVIIIYLFYKIFKKKKPPQSIKQPLQQE